MGKKIQEVHKQNGDIAGYLFYCPGCKEQHYFTLDRWSFDGDKEKPTFSPSLLYPTKKIRCHLFLRQGNIQFLSDCGHDLAGKTIECPDWED